MGRSTRPSPAFSQHAPYHCIVFKSGTEITYCTDPQPHSNIDDLNETLRAFKKNRKVPGEFALAPVQRHELEAIRSRCADDRQKSVLIATGQVPQPH